MSDVECPVCLETDHEIYFSPVCNHPCCFQCLEKLGRDWDDKIVCPLCRQTFDVPIQLRRNEMRYCLNLFCVKGSGCPKIHIDEIFPPSEDELRRPPRAAPSLGPEPVLEPEPEPFYSNPNVLYCCNLLCPGGPGATCGKMHESDIFGDSIRL